MGPLQDPIAWAVATVMSIIQAIGFPGIFILMGLESMCIPIPSEVILTFGGALVSSGGISFTGDPIIDTFLVALSGTLGCTFGSIIAYYIGMKGGRQFICRYGRYLLINEKHLDSADAWFKKYGDTAVFTSRILPIIRTFISLPAGICRMDFKRFVVLSTLGSLPWCLALSYLGLFLGDNWEEVEGIYNQLEILLVIVGAIVVVWYFWKRRRSRRDFCSVDDQTE